MQSWMTELAGRIASLQDQNGASSEPLFEAIVPLFVDAKELWVLFDEGRSELSDVALFSTRRSESGGTPDLRAEVATRLQLDSRTFLILGDLPSVTSAEGPLIRVEVIAIPNTFHFEIEENAQRMHRIPFKALGQPRLVEEREGLQEGKTVRYEVQFVGNLPLWGATLEVVQHLRSL